MKIRGSDSVVSSPEVTLQVSLDTRTTEALVGHQVCLQSRTTDRTFPGDMGSLHLSSHTRSSQGFLSHNYFSLHSGTGKGTLSSRSLCSQLGFNSGSPQGLLLLDSLCGHLGLDFRSSDNLFLLVPFGIQLNLQGCFPLSCKFISSSVLDLTLDLCSAFGFISGQFLCRNLSLESSSSLSSRLLDFIVISLSLKS